MTAQSGLGFSGIAAIQIPDNGALGEYFVKTTLANYDYDWTPGVSANNSFGVLYIRGGEFTDDSVRFILGVDDVPQIQRRTSGVWNPGRFEVGGATLLLGQDISISGSGDHLRYDSVEGSSSHLVVATEFTDQGSVPPQTAVLGPKVSDVVIQPVFDTQITASTIDLSLTGTIPRLITALRFKTGSVAASADVALLISDGALSGGAVFVRKNLPASTFPASSDLILELDTALSVHTGVSVFIEFTSSANFSLLGDSLGDIYLAINAFPEDEQDIFSFPDGFNRLLVDAEGSTIVDSSGNLVARAA